MKKSACFWFYWQYFIEGVLVNGLIHFSLRFFDACEVTADAKNLEPIGLSSFLSRFKALLPTVLTMISIWFISMHRAASHTKWLPIIGLGAGCARHHRHSNAPHPESRWSHSDCRRSSAMIFSPLISIKPSTYVKGIALMRRRSYKCLGLVIDKHLFWWDHIASLKANQVTLILK